MLRRLWWGVALGASFVSVSGLAAEPSGNTTDAATGNVKFVSESLETSAGCGCAADRGVGNSCGACNPCGDCNRKLYEDCCCQPLWTVKAGAVILDRVTPRSAVLLQNTVTGETIANADQFDFNWAGGVDVSLIRHFGCNALEVRYFGVDGWTANQTLTTPAIWNFPTNPPLFGLGVANIDATYTSRLYSTEVNWRHDTNDWLTWLIGFRWIEMSEDLTFVANFSTNQATIFSDVDNHLYGAQIGADMNLWHNGSKLAIDGVIKAGIYGNSADNAFGVTQDGGPPFSAGQQRGQVAFLGEIGLTGVYQWTDHLALRAGYQVLWLEGVAVAGDQLTTVDVLSGTGIDTNGGVFYHGAIFGADVTW